MRAFNMKKLIINTQTIAALNPCNSRFNNWKAHHDSFNGDILEFLELENITPQDKVWVAVRVLPRQLVETFAVDCVIAAAAYAADAAAYAADAADAYAAAAADAAAYAADAAARLQERKKQVECIIELLKKESKRCQQK